MLRPHLPVFNSRVLTVSLLVAIPVLLIGAAIVVSIGEARLRAAETERLAQMAEYTAGTVDAYVYRRILDAALLARVPEIRRAADAGNQVAFDEASVATHDRKWQAAPAAAAADLLESSASKFLADLVANDSVYREVLVTDRRGRLVAASAASSDFYQADEEWWALAYEGGRGRISVTDVRRDESAGVYAFEIAVPVQVPSGRELAGVMKIVADSREMLAGIAGLELGTTTEALLVRGDGTIVFSRRAGAIGDRFFGAELLRQRVDERVARQEALGTMTFEAQAEDGGARILAVAPSQLARTYPQLSWMIALSKDGDELRAPFRSLVLYLVLVAALTGLAVLSMGLWLSLRLAAPAIDPAYDMHLVEHPRIPRIET